MKKIELEQWEPFPGDPRRMQYAGQRVAQEVFEEQSRFHLSRKNSKPSSSMRERTVPL